MKTRFAPHIFLEDSDLDMVSDEVIINSLTDDRAMDEDFNRSNTRQGKLAEIAFIRHYGLDDSCLVSDYHGDVRHGGCCIDVKHMDPHDNYCIWAKKKNGVWNNKRFTHLAFLRGNEREWEYLGAILKGRFARQKYIAPGGPAADKLDAGTWYVIQSQLGGK